MKRSRFSEEQIVAILKQGEAGMKTSELCRQNGISEATYYNWKAKYGGLAVSDVQKLKRLEEENGKLKRDLRLKTCLRRGNPFDRVRLSALTI